MELQIPSFPVLLSFFLCIFIVLKISKKTSKKSNPPPGPRKYPLIGNIPQLIGGLPHHRLKDLAKKHGPVMSIQLGEISVVIISSAKAAKEVLKTQDVIFADRPLILIGKMVLYDGMDIVFAPYGDYWRGLRKICALELLSCKRVQQFRTTREKEVSDVIRFLHSKAGSPVNLTKTLYTLTNTIMAITAIGKKIKSQQALLSIIDDAIAVAGGFNLADVFPSIKFLHYLTGEIANFQKIHDKADKILEDIIKDQKASMSARDHQGEADNLLAVLLNLQQSGDIEVPLTNDSIKGVILEMFGAGSDTSSKAAEWAMIELMRSPKAMKKAQEEVRRIFGEKGKVDESRFHELKYMKLVIKEIFRLHPSAAIVPRECREKTKVFGYDIAPKTKIIVNLYAIGRDANVWNEAEKFWPERFEDSPIDFKGTNFELIPFGAGKRICPGMTLGLANVEIFLANLLYHFDWKLPDGVTPDTLDMSEAFGGVLRRKTDLNVIPIPFSPLPPE